MRDAIHYRIGHNMPACRIKTKGLLKYTSKLDNVTCARCKRTKIFKLSQPNTYFVGQVQTMEPSYSGESWASHAKMACVLVGLVVLLVTMLHYLIK